MEILHLTLKKWFDLIASGVKTVEYRKFKQYWEKRLLKTYNQCRDFDEIHFRNGYSKTAPFMREYCNGIAIIPGTGGLLFQPQNGEKLTGKETRLTLSNECKERKKHVWYWYVRNFYFSYYFRDSDQYYQNLY